jgi:hypothetical protein
MSPDPYDGSYDATNPQSLNRYTYVLNNPLAFTDPSGQKKPVLPPFLAGGGGGLPIIDGNTSYFGSGWNEFQTIETFSSPDGDGSYSYTPGGWSSIASSDSGNSVGSDGTIASNYDEGVGGTVTTSLLGLTFSGLGTGYTGIATASAIPRINAPNKPGPPKCQGLVFAAAGYGALSAYGAAKDDIATLGNYIKSAAPLLGAGTASVISTLGEPTLGLLVGASVESGIAVGAAISVGVYVSYQGVTAAIDSYKQQNATCKTQ